MLLEARSVTAGIFDFVPELLRPADMLGKDVGIYVVEQAVGMNGGTAEMWFS